jgi:4-hydroxybenzoate polyprenyltransferase
MTAGQTVALAVGAYVAITLAYSFLLKRVALVDVTTLAGLFTLRLIVGAVGAGVVASPWLLVFSMFLFSSLCFAKRYVEITRAAAAGQTMTGRGYLPEDTALIFALGVGTGISSVVIMVLYIMFDAFQQTFYGDTAWLWAFPMILFLWLSRVWLVAGRGKLDDDPVAFAVQDTPSLALGVALLASFIVAWSGVF